VTRKKKRQQMLHAAAAIARAGLRTFVKEQWNALAYVERFTVANAANKGIGDVMNRMGAYIGGVPPGQHVGDPTAIPLGPLAAQISRDLDSYPPPAGLSPGAPNLTAPSSDLTALAVPASPSAELASPVANEPSSPATIDHPTIIGAPVVSHLRRKPIAPHEHKARSDAHTHIGAEYCSAAVQISEKLKLIQATDENRETIAQARDLLSKFVIAIQLGKAKEHDYHHIEMMRAVPYLITRKRTDA